MSTTALQAPDRRAASTSFSPRLLLFRIAVLGDRFDQSVMVALAVYFSLTIPDYGTLHQRDCR